NNAIIYAEIQGIFKAGAVTNEEGYFEIHNVPAGNYMFNIHYYDSRPAYIYNVRVDAGRNTEVVFRHPFVLFESYSYYESNANEYSNSLSDVVVAEYQASVLDASSASYSRVLYSEISRVPGLSISSLQRVENFANLDMTDQLKNKDILDADALAALKSDPRSNRIRRNFRDYGFWVPNMLTDKNGNAAFTVEFPDNITQWKTIVAAMNDKMQSGIGTTQSKSYKPLSAHLGVPSYLVAGDSILAIGKLLNYTGVAIPVKTWFELDGTTMLSGNQAPVNSLKETIPVCLHNPGEFRLVYGLQKDDGYMDGEQRILEVMPDGVTKTRAQLLKLNSDTVVNLPKDESLLKRSLLVTNNPLDLIKQELKSLKDYEHGCNEQTASKLKALLLEKKLSAHLESEFEGEKDIDKHLKTLEKNQLEDGSWGWWGKNTADIWITMYITDAINRAVIDGYRTKAHIKGATFLKTKLDQLPVSRQLEVLNLLASIPFPMDYSAYMDKFSHHRLSLQDSLQYIRFLQLQDSSVSVEPVISSLIKDEDGIYWGEELFDVKVNIFQTSMLAYKILKTAGGHEDLLARIRSFFLNYKTKPRNTIEQATMLENFVTDMMKESTLQQQLTGTVKINDSILGTNYPYTLSFFDPANIRIEKTGAPLRIFVQDAVLERNPESVDSLISLKTYFIQEKERGDTLRTAANCTLTVEVINQKPLEYAFIEVPLPAGFIYGQNNSGMNESYRKQYNHKTVIACTRLPAGKHLFTIVLTPRFEGTFTLLPATIYPMYFPQNSVYSHSRKIVVNSEK
ncbi:MAG: hypothetical protein KKD31_19175, partial [Bacteroidetes bacterium]|nr:hypothetical protein [Bacteroidota bacterium]